MAIAANMTDDGCRVRCRQDLTAVLGERYPEDRTILYNAIKE